MSENELSTLNLEQPEEQKEDEVHQRERLMSVVSLNVRMKSTSETIFHVFFFL